VSAFDEVFAPRLALDTAASTINHVIHMIVTGGTIVRKGGRCRCLDVLIIAWGGGTVQSYVYGGCLVEALIFALGVRDRDEIMSIST